MNDLPPHKENGFEIQRRHFVKSIHEVPDTKMQDIGTIRVLHAICFDYLRAEDFEFDRDVFVTLRPGYPYGYPSDPSGTTCVKGSIKVTDGTITVSEGCIKIGN